tara:strand:+ start:476 stop:1015 length:540 start_codon:yes stop_codon:yes gene_type:complete
VVEHLLSVLGGEGIVDVPVKEHLFEFSFALGPKAAFPVIGRRVFESAEEHIPNGKVGEILVMFSTLMVNPVHLGTLEKIADPTGSLDVHVVKVFTKRSIDQAPSTGFDRKTEKKKIDGADHEGIDDNLARMLVERGDGLDTTRAMMNLMKGQPKKIHVVTQTVPPVEKQGHDKVAKKPT